MPAIGNTDAYLRNIHRGFVSNRGDVDIKVSSLRELNGRVERVEMEVDDSARLRSAGWGIDMMLSCICTLVKQKR